MSHFEDVKETCMHALWAASFANLGEVTAERIIQLVKRIETTLSEQIDISPNKLNYVTENPKIPKKLYDSCAELEDYLSHLQK
jgi:type III secretion system FlhB-like substrate exporter